MSTRTIDSGCLTRRVVRDERCASYRGDVTAFLKAEALRLPVSLSSSVFGALKDVGLVVESSKL